MDDSKAAVFTLLYVLWGFITVGLIVLLSYRATLLKEEDHTSINAAEENHFRQELELALIVRRSLLTGGIIALSVLSGALLLTSLGFSIYYASFKNL